MDDLVTWLKAQIDVDASNTEAVIAGTLEELRRDGCPTTREKLLAVDHTLARRLREVEAKRKLLDWLDAVDRFMDQDHMAYYRLGGEVDTDEARRLLAAPYSDRPGYRAEEWAP